MKCLTILGQAVEIEDSEIESLVRDLGLIPGRRRPFFCELYRQELARRERERKILQRELYLRNRKYSRHVYASLVDSPRR